MSDTILLFFHTVGVIIFFAGIICALLAKPLAERTNNPQILNHTFYLINFYDKWLTPVSVAVILVSGIMLAIRAHFPILGTSWIFWSILLWILTGVIFIVKVLPLQNRLESLTKIDEANLSTDDWVIYKQLSKSWSIWAHITFVIFILVLIIMIFKPAL